MDPITLGFIGKVSSGKSSVINSLLQGFGSNVSLQRETFKPIRFVLSKDGSPTKLREIGDELERQHTENEANRDDIVTLREENLSKIIDTCSDESKIFSRLGMNELVFIDFPGLDDAEDSSGKFLNVFTNLYSQCNMVVYVTSAESAFRDKSEIELFDKVKRMIEQVNNEGTYIELIVIVNKFDDSDDDDLLEIFDRIDTKTGEIKLFKYSAHKVLMNGLKLPTYIPNKKIRAELRKITRTSGVDFSESDIDAENCYQYKGEKIFSGDHDNFIGYIDTAKSRLDQLNIDSYLKYNGIIFKQMINDNIDRDQFIKLWKKLNLQKNKPALVNYIFDIVIPWIVDFLKASTKSDIRLRIIESILQYVDLSHKFVEDVVKNILLHKNVAQSTVFNSFIIIYGKDSSLFSTEFIREIISQDNFASHNLDIYDIAFDRLINNIISYSEYVSNLFDYLIFPSYKYTFMSSPIMSIPYIKNMIKVNRKTEKKFLPNESDNFMFVCAYLNLQDLVTQYKLGNLNKLFQRVKGIEENLIYVMATVNPENYPKYPTYKIFSNTRLYSGPDLSQY